MPRPAAPEREVEEPLGMTGTALRAVAVIAALAMVLFWAWIFSGGPKKQNPDYLDDRAYVTRSAERCRQLIDDLKALPNAEAASTAKQRADVLDQANELVSGMVDDLESTAPRTGDDAKSLKGWIADWRTYVENREDYARRLRTDPGARLLLDANPGGDPVDRPIEVFADVNDMPDCATPGDVG